MHSHIPDLRIFIPLIKRAPPMTIITKKINIHVPHGRRGSKMEALELGSSGEESEEGECTSDGEDNPLSLLGIPLDSDRKQPELVEYRDENEIETGSEVEGDERDEGEKDERDGMDDAGDRILPEKLMLLGQYIILI